MYKKHRPVCAKPRGQRILTKFTKYKIWRL